MTEPFYFQLSQTDEWFNITSQPSGVLTTENEINSSLQEAAQQLLNYYVRIQGLNVSQVLFQKNSLGFGVFP